MDLWAYVINTEQESIDTLIAGTYERKEWLGKGSFLKIVFKNRAGKSIDAHPRIESVLKKLAGSSLTPEQQQEILNGCEHCIADEYLKNLHQSKTLEKLIMEDQVTDEYCSF